MLLLEGHSWRGPFAGGKYLPCPGFISTHIDKCGQWPEAGTQPEQKQRESVRTYGPKSNQAASTQHQNPDRRSILDKHQDPQNCLKSKCGQQPEAGRGQQKNERVRTYGPKSNQAASAQHRNPDRRSFSFFTKIRILRIA